MGVILFIISIILSAVMFPLGLAFGLVSMIFKGGSISRKFKLMAIAIDQLGNVVCAELFNHTLIHDSDYKFGNPDETISSVLGKNVRSGTLTMTGKALNLILGVLEKNHSIKSIEADELGL